jgi:hypothetical protein
MTVIQKHNALTPLDPSNVDVCQDMEIHMRRKSVEVADAVSLVVEKIIAMAEETA